MRRTKKIAKNNAVEKPQLADVQGIGTPTVREKLESLSQHVSALQDAKLGAEGLRNVLGFCAVEYSKLESTADTMLSGLEEVALLLYKNLERETNALEREIWFWDTEALPREKRVFQHDLKELVERRDEAARKGKAIAQALAGGAQVDLGVFSARLNGKGRLVVS